MQSKQELIVNTFNVEKHSEVTGVQILVILEKSMKYLSFS